MSDLDLKALRAKAEEHRALPDGGIAYFHPDTVCDLLDELESAYRALVSFEIYGDADGDGDPVMIHARAFVKENLDE